MYNRRFTPERIDSLLQNEIFVFGSNLAGCHGGGAARAAMNRFGAVWGQGVGLQGQSFAIPTMQGGPETIQPYVDEFVAFAKAHPRLTFLVTKIGCGIAGFKEEEIAPLFSAAIDVENILLPASFVNIIHKELVSIHHDCMTHAHGITKTFVEIAIELNEEMRFRSPEDVMDALRSYFQRFFDRGDDIAFTAMRILNCVLCQGQVFDDGRLNPKKLHQMVFDEKRFDINYEKAYLDYCKERLTNLIAYLNEFRRYKCSEDIMKDLHELKVFDFNNCGPNTHDNFFNLMDEPIWPHRHFETAIREYWSEISTHGILDGWKLRELLLNKHERGIRKYGLPAVIRHDYIKETGCHAEFYRPRKEATGPIYIVKGNRHFVRSCGLGKGPESIYHKDKDEAECAFQLLLTDEKYEFSGRYAIPKTDYSLPVYNDFGEKMVFENQAEKEAFIHSRKRANETGHIQ